jgi:hypothetical protein
MADARVQFDEEMPARAITAVAAPIKATKPTLTIMLIVAILLSVWMGLRAV